MALLSHSRSLSLMIWKSSCIWDLLLYYFTELPQPIHGVRARVGQVSGGAQMRSEPQERHSDRLLRGGGPSGTCWRRNDRLQCGGGLRWPTLYEGDQLLVGCLYQVDGELHRLYIVSCQSCFHCSIRLKLEFAIGMLLGDWTVDERVSVGGRGFGLLQCEHVKGERCLVLRAFLINVDVWCSLRSAGGAIPERPGRYVTGVGRRQTIDYSHGFGESNIQFFLRGCSCTMLGQHNILQRYRWVRGRLFGIWVRVWAPQEEPARRRRRLFLDATLPRSASRCCLKASCLSSFTLREVGVELHGSVEPSSLTVSCR